MYKNNKLVIMDDFFPNLISNFRITEYNHYLSVFPGSEVYSVTRPQDYERSYKEYSAKYPQFAGRVKYFDPGTIYNCSLFYTVFINSAYYLVPYFERESTPFIFTLYPGGGLLLNNNECDNKLRRVLSSPMLKKVIVTQEIVYRYIVNHGMVSPEKVSYIYGIVEDSDYFLNNCANKRYFGKDKNTFDICFVSGKYSARGTDKGYDTFIEACKKLVSIGNDFRFHVVGGFNKGDIDVSMLGDKIKFYGYRPKEFFVKFYPGMDMIISPTSAFKRLNGEFDGFPTGCCVQAGLCGTAVFSSDPLNMNRNFVNGSEIVITTNEVNDVINKIFYYYKSLNELYSLSLRGKEKFSQTFSVNAQLGRRVEIIKRFL